MSERGIAHFAVGQIRCLGIPVGDAAGRGAALSKILGLKGSPGWLVTPQEEAEWRFSGTVEREGKVYLYGPDVDGRPLDSILALPFAEALPYLSRLADALSALEQRGKLRFLIQTDAVLFTDAGSVLFLPPQVIKEIRGLSPFAVNADTFEAINHPDLGGQEQASFALASMLYRLITGKFPFSGSTAEEMHEQARRLEVLAPNRIVPGLAPEISDSVMMGLRRGQSGRRTGERSIGIADWAQELSAWQSVTLVREIEAEEKERVSRESASRKADQIRRFRRRTYWAKNWKVALVISIAVVAVGAVLASYLTRALAPRPTKGFTPQKVVETFYLSMNRMDSALMGACVVGKAGEGEIREATNFFVISRVTLGYEGKSNIISADVWDEQGRPDLPYPRTVFGVTSLSLAAEEPEPDPVFLLTYEKWSPTAAESGGSSTTSDQWASFQGERITDRAFLKMDRGDWVIYRIDRLDVGPVGPAN